MADTVAGLVAVTILALTHVLAGRLRSLHSIPRNAALSAAGGVSVAYVFVHLLPEIAAGQEAIEEHVPGLVGTVERHAYVVALAGLAVFYGVERQAVVARMRRRGRSEEDVAGDLPFAVSIASFGVYNAVIGYLVVEQAARSNRVELALFAFALGVHFVVNDVGLRSHHQHRYHQVGRWVLAAAVLVGFAIGTVREVSEAALAVVIAFIGGGVVLNVLKEELPDQRMSRFGPFALGAAVYSVILLAA